MKMNDLYELFVEHTSLKDSMYKTVFIQIQEALDTIQHTEWISLSYRVGEDNTFEIDFKKQKVIPLYATEIIQNVFENYYTFPDGSEIIIKLKYNDKPYTIKVIDNDRDCPEDIAHLFSPSFFNFFLVDYPVKDIFSEFDKLFAFTRYFKDTVSTVYEPLKRKFDQYESKRRVDSGEVTQSNVSGTRVFLENLKGNRERLLSEIKGLDEEIKKMEEQYNSFQQIMNSKEGLILDHQKSKSEHAYWKNLFEEYKAKSDSVIELLVNISLELQDHIEFDPVGNADEISYLRDKKVQFENERDDLGKTLNETKKLMDIALTKVQDVDKDMKRLSDFNQPQAEMLKSKLDEARALRDNKYTELVTIEAEVKEQTNRSNNDLHQLHESKSMTPIPIDNNDIISHLSKPLQPNSVTVVINYLRYYFAYIVSSISTRIESQYKNMPPSIIQALACKITLIKNFGVYYKNLFSIVEIIDDRIEHVNILEA